MSNTDKIEVGDFVSVHFNTAQLTLCRKAIVLHIPSATGDSWIFKQIKDYEFERDKAPIIHYVSEGCTITLIRKGDEQHR